MIPWDFQRISPDLTNVNGNQLAVDPNIPQTYWTDKEYMAWEIRMRRGEGQEDASSGPEREFQKEIDAYNEDYGGWPTVSGVKGVVWKNKRWFQ